MAKRTDIPDDTPEGMTEIDLKARYRDYIVRQLKAIAHEIELNADTIVDRAGLKGDFDINIQIPQPADDELRVPKMWVRQEHFFEASVDLLRDMYEKNSQTKHAE